MEMLKSLLKPLSKDVAQCKSQLDEQALTNKKMLEGLEKVNQLKGAVTKLATKAAVAEAAVVTLQSTAASSAGSVSSLASSAKRHRAASDAGQPQQQRSGQHQDADVLRRWVNGFRRPVLAQVRKAYFQWVKEHAPTINSQEMTAKFARASQSYSIHFVMTTAAFAFQKWAKDAGMTWQDPRDKSWHVLKVRGDLPEEVRMKQRVLGKVHPLIVGHLEGKGWHREGMGIGSNGFRDELFVIDDDVWVFFRGGTDIHGKCTVLKDDGGPYALGGSIRESRRVDSPGVGGGIGCTLGVAFERTKRRHFKYCWYRWSSCA